MKNFYDKNGTKVNAGDVLVSRSENIVDVAKVELRAGKLGVVASPSYGVFVELEAFCRPKAGVLEDCEVLCGYCSVVID